MVERVAFNHVVVGSIPTDGGLSMFLFGFFLQNYNDSYENSRVFWIFLQNYNDSYENSRVSLNY